MQLAHERAPLAHVKGHHEQDRRERGHRDQRGPPPDEERDEQQRERMHDTRDGGTATVLHVGGGAGDRAGGRHAAEQWSDEVRHPLRHELGVRPVLPADHPVGDDGGQE